MSEGYIDENAVVAAFRSARSDRMGSRHSYESVYAPILRELAGMPSARILDIGVGDISGLVAIHSLMKSARLFSASPVPVSGLPDYVTALSGDPYLCSTWSSFPKSFDLIIDDGTHKLNNLYPIVPTLVRHLAPAGFLLIEDIQSDSDAHALQSRLPRSRLPEVPQVSCRHDDRILVYRDSRSSQTPHDGQHQLFAVTPTGDRPEAFELCVRYMNRQFTYPTCWIIVDDGQTDSVARMEPLIAVPHVILREPPMDGHSLMRNMRSALSLVAPGSAVCVIEDDDWYPEFYISEVSRLLSISPYVGSPHSHNYNVAQRMWNIDSTTRYPLHTCAFAGEALEAYRRLVESTDRAYSDSTFYYRWRGSKADNTEYRPIHIVGYGSGRRGTTVPHRGVSEAAGWCQDRLGLRLYEWVGDDIRNYASKDMLMDIYAYVRSTHDNAAPSSVSDDQTRQ